MAQEWSPDGVTCNAIAPGYYKTELTAPFFADPANEAWTDGQTAMGRNGNLEDLHGTAIILAAPASDYVTGQMIFVDGGFTRNDKAEDMKALVYSAPNEVIYRDELDVRKLTLAEITFISTYTYAPADLRAAVPALYSGALGPLDWVEEHPIHDGARAFQELDEDRLAAAKVVLRPT